MGEEVSLKVLVTDSDVDDIVTLFMDFTNITTDEDTSHLASLTGNNFSWVPSSNSAVELA